MNQCRNGENRVIYLTQADVDEFDGDAEGMDDEGAGNSSKESTGILRARNDKMC